MDAVTPRTYWFERIERAWQQRPIVWLAGVRRVGKTCIVRSLPEIEYFDCELPGVRRQLSDPEGFLGRLRTHFRKKVGLS
jgi:predicted AAA+ superfamily ATPase